MNERSAPVEANDNAAIRITERLASLLAEDDPERLNVILQVVREELGRG